MQTGLIGVIVPVYKTEKYIAECIESILAQTYTKFRLILVDDGSPDSAGTICDQYAAKDNRITVIHQENAGVTRARARGVEEASDCEWITFVDSDDTLTTKALYNLISTRNKETDIIIIDYYKCLSNETFIPIYKFRSYLLSEMYVSRAPWGKLIRRNIFDEFTFSIPRNITIAEDLIMNLRLAFNTEKKVQIIKEQIYKYRENKNGAMNSHIRTVKNEEDCLFYKIQSIPNNVRDKYTVFTIPARLLRFREFWGFRYNVKDMKKSLFYQELKADIKKYNYKLTFLDYIIFNNTNIIIRILFITIKKIINVFYTNKS